MAKEKMYRMTLRGVSSKQAKALETIGKKRSTSRNTEILMAVDQYISEWKRAEPDWFPAKKVKQPA